MNQIKTERIKQSLSQKRLASLAGIDARTLRKIEKGEVVSAESFRAVCLALGLEPSSMTKESEIVAVQSPKPLPARPPGRTSTARVRIVPLFIIGLILSVPFGVVQWFDWYYFDKTPNLNIEAKMSGDCGEGTGDAVARQIVSALGSSSPTFSSVKRSTGKCTVFVDTFLADRTEDEIIKRLKPLPIEATVLWYRPSR